MKADTLGELSALFHRRAWLLSDAVVDIGQAWRDGDEVPEEALGWTRDQWLLTIKMGDEVSRLLAGEIPDAPRRFGESYGIWKGHVDAFLSHAVELYYWAFDPSAVPGDLGKLGETLPLSPPLPTPPRMPPIPPGIPAPPPVAAVASSWWRGPLKLIKLVTSKRVRAVGWFIAGMFGIYYGARIINEKFLVTDAERILRDLENQDALQAKIDQKIAACGDDAECVRRVNARYARVLEAMQDAVVGEECGIFDTPEGSLIGAVLGVLGGVVGVDAVWSG